MRKTTYAVAVSLDGYIAGPGGTMDWLRWSEDVTSSLAETWKGVDAILIGRKTFGDGSQGAGPSGIKTYLFSRTLTQAPAGVELVREDAARFVRALKTEVGGDILVMGGGELAASLIEVSLVDEISLNVHPVLLGGGIPMFRPMARRIEFQLVQARAIAQGCVAMTYLVVNRSNAPKAV